MGRNKTKVPTQEVETKKEEVITTDAPVTSDEVPTQEVETLSEDAESENTDILESEEQKIHREEVQSRSFVDGQFTVKVNLKHNGKIYKVGDSITLDENEVKSLLSDGIIE